MKMEAVLSYEMLGQMYYPIKVICNERNVLYYM